MKEAIEDSHDSVTSAKRHKRGLRKKPALKQYFLGVGDSNIWYYCLLAAFTVASLWTRLYKLSEPTHIA